METTYLNPDTGGGDICRVDPDPLKTESNEANNNCSDSVAFGHYVNPLFVPACDIDIALILDASGSIGATNAQTVRDAIGGVGGLLELLEGTDTRLSIIEFAETADTPIGYTAVTAANVTNIFDPYLTDPTVTDIPLVDQYYDQRVGLYTNWDAAFQQAVALPTPPDLVMFFTDGVPNTTGAGPGNNTPIIEQAISIAAIQANILKGQGSHIFGIGVGTVTESSFEYITDGVNSHRYPTETIDLTTADYFIGAWSELQDGLTAVLLSACGGTINVTKLIDADGNLGTTGDQTPAAGWEFTVDVTGNARRSQRPQTRMGAAWCPSTSTWAATHRPRPASRRRSRADTTSAARSVREPPTTALRAQTR